MSKMGQQGSETSPKSQYRDLPFFLLITSRYSRDDCILLFCGAFHNAATILSMSYASLLSYISKDMVPQIALATGHCLN